MIGFFAAISAVLSWTFACSIWRRESEKLLPRQINIYKNVLASIFFLPVVLTITWFSDVFSIIVLMISGIIGISIGDTLYINSLKIIGTRKTLSFEALTPLIATTLGTFSIDEIYPQKVWIGSLIVSFSLFMIVRQNTFQKEDSKQINILGILCALGSVLCAVLAALLSRIILISSTLTPLQTTEIRLLSASIFLFLIFKKDFLNLLNNRSITKQNHSNLILSTLLGTNFGILFQQMVFKFLPIGIGWTLLSLSPVFALFISKREGDEINKLTIFYSFLSFIGVAITLS
ncbi:EamA family transporter [Prochlorococcus marinus]|uniref:EamA family transporter n=1 Tax=Prochlorococcus marinus TaxID=1219 RepID=UPI0022B36048|nr:EamA family transporter [Prochlorococcus marinus]